jgi:sarcosine oxidase subunit alpha
LETTVPGVYVAGDVAGVEEATTAMIEGWVAGYSILMSLRGERNEWMREREKLLDLLRRYRSSPVSAKVRTGLEKVVMKG